MASWPPLLPSSPRLSVLGEGQSLCGVQQASHPAAHKQGLLTGTSSTYATLPEAAEFSGAHYNVQHGHPALRISTGVAGKLSGFYSSLPPEEDCFCWGFLLVHLFFVNLIWANEACEKLMPILNLPQSFELREWMDHLL